MTVPEASQGSQPRNNDGDTFDDVLAVQTLPLGGPPAPQNLSVAADAIAVTGNTAVFITPENAEGPNGVHCGPTVPPGGCDLTGDGDANDRVLRIYNPTDGILETGLAAEEFVVSGSLVAFRGSEAAQNGADLNGDGDTADAVSSRRPIPPRRASSPRPRTSCGPRSPASAAVRS